MTIYDLMLNDLVLYKGHVKKVVGIKRSYDLIDLAFNDKEFFTCSVTEIEPIPLTPEILEANGFEYEDANEIGTRLGVTKKQMLRFDSAHYIGYIGGYLFIDLENKDFRLFPIKLIRKIETVHELQHALRLCGLNDLADNLKIKQL